MIEKELEDAYRINTVLYSQTCCVFQAAGPKVLGCLCHLSPKSLPPGVCLIVSIGHCCYIADTVRGTQKFTIIWPF